MKKILLTLLKYWLPPLVWALLIFSFSSRPTGVVSYFDWQDFIVKKTAHIIEYGILTALLYRAFKVSHVRKRNAALYAIFLVVLYGISDELHQTLVPGRTSRLRDIGFDTIGGVLAIYVIWNLLPRVRGKLKALAEILELL